MSTAYERATFTLPSAILRGLEAFAASERRSRSNVVAIALEWFLTAAAQRELETSAIHQAPAVERTAAQAGDAP